VELDRTPPHENAVAPRRDDATLAHCVECLGAVGHDSVADKNGGALCRTCAEIFYVACASCGGLVPRDEALPPHDASTVLASTVTAGDAVGDSSGGSSGGGDGARLVCASCFAGGLPEAIDAEEMETLVRQFVELHAEKKSIETRLDELKERLKVAARGQQRVEGAVVMRAGEACVRVSYTLKTTADAGRVAALSRVLDAEDFSTLFKTTYSPVKEKLEEFLADTDDGRAAAREALRDAVQQTEVQTLTVVAQKKARPTKREKG
jgi:hypothetical protein